MVKNTLNINKPVETSRLGSAVYILDKRLVDGKKTGRCVPRSHRCIYLGHSPRHSVDVPWILFYWAVRLVSCNGRPGTYLPDSNPFGRTRTIFTFGSSLAFFRRPKAKSILIDDSLILRSVYPLLYDTNEGFFFNLARTPDPEIPRFLVEENLPEPRLLHSSYLIN